MGTGDDGREHIVYACQEIGEREWMRRGGLIGPD